MVHIYMTNRGGFLCITNFTICPKFGEEYINRVLVTQHVRTTRRSEKRIEKNRPKNIRLKKNRRRRDIVYKRRKQHKNTQTLM